MVLKTSPGRLHHEEFAWAVQEESDMRCALLPDYSCRRVTALICCCNGELLESPLNMEAMRYSGRADSEDYGWVARRSIEGKEEHLLLTA
jgi:hypothetical protein